MRLTIIVVYFFCYCACFDVRSYEGNWAGELDPAFSGLLSGISQESTASLELEEVTKLTISGQLAIDGVLSVQPLVSSPSLTTDLGGEISVTDSELSAYITSVEPDDGAGRAMIIVSLLGNNQVRFRISRITPELYGVFTLERQSVQ